MLTLIRRILKDNIGVFLYIYIIQIILRLVKSIFDDLTILDTVYGLWIMVVATFAVIYSTNILYRLIYTRQSFFYYTLKYTLNQILLVTAGVQILLNFVFYLTYCESGLLEIVGKLLSLTSYFMLATLFLYLTRIFKSKKVGRNLFLLSLLASLGTYAVVYYNVIKDRIGEKIFGIGFTQDSIGDSVRHIYMAITPLYLVDVKGADLSYLMTTSNMVNISIVVIGLVIYLAIRKLRINW